MSEKYELKNGKILQFGHTMFLEDVVNALNCLDKSNKVKQEELDEIDINI